MTNAAIAQRAENVRAGQKQGECLIVVPILGPSHTDPVYQMLTADIAGKVRVTEIGSAGSVNVIRVHNDCDTLVYLMDGQELRGAKQNRILNTDVLVPARTKLDIPVSCVERGRWHYSAPPPSPPPPPSPNVSGGGHRPADFGMPGFVPGKAAPLRTRAAKLYRVRDSLKRGFGHDADQQAVWEEVDQIMDEGEVASRTAALSDAYAQREKKLAEYRAMLKLPEDSIGVAVFQRGRLQGLDLFDRHSTLEYFWESLIDSYAIELLQEGISQDSASPQTREAEATRAALHRAAMGNWESFKAPGEGVDWRLEDDQLVAAALVYQEQVVIHLQLFPKDVADAPQGRRIYRRNFPRVI